MASSPTAVATGKAKASAATCPPGKVAIAGGVDQTNVSGSSAYHLQQGSNLNVVGSSRSTQNSWLGKVENPTASTKYFVTTVVCARAAP